MLSPPTIKLFLNMCSSMNSRRILRNWFTVVANLLRSSPKQNITGISMALTSSITRPEQGSLKWTTQMIRDSAWHLILLQNAMLHARETLLLMIGFQLLIIWWISSLGSPTEVADLGGFESVFTLQHCNLVSSLYPFVLFRFGSGKFSWFVDEINLSLIELIKLVIFSCISV